jgi:hypothetical protein
MFKGSNGSPDTTLDIGSAPNNINLRVIKLSKNDPEKEKLYTNLPYNYTYNDKPYIILHYLVENTNNTSGDIYFNLDILITNTDSPNNLLNYTLYIGTDVSNNINIKSSVVSNNSSNTYNHYVVYIYFPDNIISKLKENSFILFNYGRGNTETYDNDIFITSLEFNY